MAGMTPQTPKAPIGRTNPRKRARNFRRLLIHSIDRYSRRMAAESLRPFRHLSPAIAPKQHFLTVDLTVKLARANTMLPIFKCLQVLETIEWE
jgi:hypothetical protein